MKSALATTIIAVLAFTSSAQISATPDNSTIIGSDNNSTGGVVPVFVNSTAVDGNGTSAANPNSNTTTPVDNGSNSTVPTGGNNNSTSTPVVVGNNSTTGSNTTTPVVVPVDNNSTSGSNSSTDGNATAPTSGPPVIGGDNSTSPVVGGDNSTVGNSSGSPNGTDNQGSTPSDSNVVVLPVATLINCDTANSTQCPLRFGVEFCCATASGVLSTDATNRITQLFCYNQTLLASQGNSTYEYGNYNVNSLACLSGTYIQMTAAAVAAGIATLLL